MDGVVRAPSVFSMTLGSAPSITATQEFVVPRSIPITLLKSLSLLLSKPLGRPCLKAPLPGFPLETNVKSMQLYGI